MAARAGHGPVMANRRPRIEARVYPDLTLASASGTFRAIIEDERAGRPNAPKKEEDR